MSKAHNSPLSQEVGKDCTSLLAIAWEVLAVPLMGDERRDDLVDEDKSEEGEEDGVLEAKDNTKTEVDDDLHQEVRA